MNDWKTEPRFDDALCAVIEGATLQLLTLLMKTPHERAVSESAIEHLLLYALCLMMTPLPRVGPASNIICPPQMGQYNVPWKDKEILPDVPEFVVVFQQLVVSDYRLDFAIAAKFGKKTRWIAIECDGHDYHERTKEQAERDRSRDRKLTALGFTVMRFTGREIWRDANACARDVTRLLVRWADEDRAAV